MEKMPNFSKYLPSKKFTKLIFGLGAILLILIAVSSHFGSRSSFNPKKQAISSQGTLGEIVTRDSNANGIADWEESLWGLDPKGDGPANKKTIEQKKASANITPSDNTQDENQTDKFSQELLSTVLALHQSGTLTPEVLARVAESVGDNVDTKRASTRVYTMNDLRLYPSNTYATKNTYKNELKDIISQYENIDLGSETIIMADGMGTGGADALSKLSPLAEAYSALGRQIIALKTPPAIAQNALDLANSSAQMGSALIQVQKLYTDAIAGMVGVDDYTKANELSEMATQTLASYFAN